MHIDSGDAATDGRFEVREVPVHAFGDPEALGGRRDHERATIAGADFTRDETAVGQPIENARQRGALVREAAVQLGDRRRREGREEREDVGFALRQAVVTQIGQIQADPVRGSMNRWDQTQ